MDMEFEWEEAKRQSNLEKHGVDFVDAARVLADARLYWKIRGTITENNAVSRLEKETVYFLS